jgi:hypothetical protein
MTIQAFGDIGSFVSGLAVHGDLFGGNMLVDDDLRLTAGPKPNASWPCASPPMARGIDHRRPGRRVGPVHQPSCPSCSSTHSAVGAA